MSTTPKMPADLPADVGQAILALRAEMKDLISMSATSVANAVNRGTSKEYAQEHGCLPSPGIMDLLKRLQEVATAVEDIDRRLRLLEAAGGSRNDG